MKKISTILLLACMSISGFSQSLLLHINGETPAPFDDKTTNNMVVTNGVPVNTAGTVVFDTGSDYLSIDPFVSFQINGSWVFECDVNVTNAMDSIYFIDWRSNTSTGHMNFAYNGVRGLFFSDRNLNGI